MPAALLDSQFAALEPPGPDEQAITVDVSGSPSHTASLIMAALHLQTATDGDTQRQQPGQ
jgi:gluconokinase